MSRSEDRAGPDPATIGEPFFPANVTLDIQQNVTDAVTRLQRLSLRPSLKSDVSLK